MKLIVISLCILFLSVLLKNIGSEFSLILVISGICILLIATVSYLFEFKESIDKYFAAVPDSENFIKPVLKAVIIAIIAQVTGNLCRDNGESALAQTTETVSKVLIIITVFPLFEAVLNIVNGLNK